MPLALVLGLCLNLVPTVRVSFPALPSAVLVGLLVPGTVTLLLGWTLVDRWPTTELALSRQGPGIVAVRVGATIVACLVAAAVASLAEDHHAVAGTCWLLTLALGVELVLPGYWWTAVLVGQGALLHADYHHVVWAGVLTSTFPAGIALVVAAGAAVARG